MSDQCLEKTCQFLLNAAGKLKEDQELSRTLTHGLSDVLHDMDDEGTYQGICKKCGAIRNETNTYYRLKPKRRQDKSIQRALRKQKAHSKNSKKTEKTMKKFIKSTSTLIIHCKICSHYEKKPTIGRSEICQIKSMRRKNTAKKKSGGAVEDDAALSRKQKSVESFLSTSAGNSRPTTPLSTSKSKKRRSSLLSRLITGEKFKSPNTSLADFLKNI